MRVIKPLTSLRFFAAMMVVAHHYWGFDSGFSGVTFFFVLSGYVLALNYAGKVSTPPERRLFWWKRFARIYPTHLLTFLLAIPLGGSLLTALPNLLLLQSLFPSRYVHYAFNSPSWSISDEAFFYAVFPFLIAALAGRIWLKLAIWLAVLVLAALLFSVISTIGVLKPSADLLPQIPALPHFAFYIFPLTRLVEFALGIGIAISAPKPRLGTGTEILTCLFAAFSVASFYLSPPPALALSAIFIPAAVLVVFVFSRSEGLISRLLSVRILVILGEASFMLYMIHWLLMSFHFAPGRVTAVLAIGVSVALHFAYEKPVQRWLMSWYFRRLENSNGLVRPSPAE